MTQPPGDPTLDAVVRARLRGLRLARGWSLETLARRSHLSASTLSRIETGHRRIALDQLVPIARALETTIDHLVEPVDDDDVVIRPHKDQAHGRTTWVLTRADQADGPVVVKMRVTARRPPDPMPAHPGHEWFTVLSGTVALHLGDRVVLVEAGEAAQFSTMTPHAVCASGGPTELIGIFDRGGREVHLDRGEALAD